MERDQEVNAFYQSKGWTVLRFWDFEVKGELDYCLKMILNGIGKNEKIIDRPRQTKNIIIL